MKNLAIRESLTDLWGVVTGEFVNIFRLEFIISSVGFNPLFLSPSLDPIPPSSLPLPFVLPSDFQSFFSPCSHLPSLSPLRSFPPSYLSSLPFFLPPCLSSFLPPISFSFPLCNLIYDNLPVQSTNDIFLFHTQVEQSAVQWILFPCKLCLCDLEKKC